MTQKKKPNRGQPRPSRKGIRIGGPKPPEESVTNTNERKKAEILEAIYSTFGNVTMSCKKVGVGRTWFYEQVKADREFANACKKVEREGKEARIDLLEAKFLEMVQGVKVEGKKVDGEAQIYKTVPSVRLITFGLETQGKDRGWFKRVETQNRKPDEDAGKTEQDIDQEIAEIEGIINRGPRFQNKTPSA